MIPSTPLGRRRLLKLADLLEEDANNKKGIKFDMETWGESKWKPDMSCNTKACALGLAALSGRFRSSGLRYKIHDYWDEVGAGNSIDIGMRCDDGTVDFDETNAACVLFNITEEQADFLFIDPAGVVGFNGARGERKMAKLIRKFVAGEIGPENDVD